MKIIFVFLVNSYQGHSAGSLAHIVLWKRQRPFSFGHPCLLRSECTSEQISCFPLRHNKCICRASACTRNTLVSVCTVICIHTTFPAPPFSCITHSVLYPFRFSHGRDACKYHFSSHGIKVSGALQASRQRKIQKKANVQSIITATIRHGWKGRGWL